MRTSFCGLFSGRSLTFKLSVSILLCLVVGIAFLSIFISNHSEKAIQEQMMTATEDAVKGTISDILQTVLSAEQGVKTMARNFEKIPVAEKDRVIPLLQSSLETLQTNDSIFFSGWVYLAPDEDNPNGRIYYTRRKNGKIITTFAKGSPLYPEREWFVETMKSGKLYWSEPYLDDEVGTLLMTAVSVPFHWYGEDKPAGVVSLAIDLAHIQGQVSNITFYKTGRFLLLSRKGLYITHPDPNIRLKMTIFELAKAQNLPQLQDAGERLAKGETGIVRMPHSSVFGDSVIFFFTPIPRLEWGVCLVFSQTQFFEPLSDLRKQILFASGAGLVFLLILISFICRRSTAPLLKLSRAAREYGVGNFSAELPRMDSHDEIGVMSQAFHKMRDSLITHIEHEKNEAAEKQKRESELEIARQIQLSSLPSTFPQGREFNIFALIKTAKEVGGDFYDFFTVDDSHVAVIIADVSGKGIPAALFMMTAKTMIRNTVMNGESAAKAFTVVNQELCANNEAGMFVTAFMGILDTKTGILTCVNAGHNPPLLKREGAGFEYLKIPIDLVLGAMADINYKSCDIKLNPKDMLFLYTDGVTEAQNVKNKFYGEERLYKILNKKVYTLEDTVNHVKADVDAFAKGAEQADDITMLLLEYAGKDSKIFETDADVNELDNVFAFLDKVMLEASVVEDFAAKIRVATEEIFVNIAHYAYAPDKGRVKVVFSKIDDAIKISFHDKGKKYNPLEQAEPDLSLPVEDRPVGGLGIYIVKKTMDFVDYKYENRENILTIKLKIKKK